MAENNHALDPAQEPHWPEAWVLAWIAHRWEREGSCHAWSGDTTRATIRELQLACQRGEVTATGLFEGETFPRAISAAEWATLEIDIAYKHFSNLPLTKFGQRVVTVRSKVRPRRDGVAVGKPPVVDAVMFPADQIRQRWPPKEPTEQLRAATEPLALPTIEPVERLKIPQPAELAEPTEAPVTEEAGETTVAALTGGVLERHESPTTGELRIDIERPKPRNKGGRPPRNLDGAIDWALEYLEGKNWPGQESLAVTLRDEYFKRAKPDPAVLRAGRNPPNSFALNCPANPSIAARHFVPLYACDALVAALLGGTLMKFIGREGLRAKGIKFSRQHIHRLEKSPDPARRFPRHVNIGQNTIAWVEPEVDAWMEARAAERGAYIPPVPPEDVTGPAASTPPGRSRRGLTA